MFWRLGSFLSDCAAIKSISPNTSRKQWRWDNTTAKTKSKNKESKLCSLCFRRVKCVICLVLILKSSQSTSTIHGWLVLLVIGVLFVIMRYRLTVEKPLWEMCKLLTFPVNVSIAVVHNKKLVGRERAGWPTGISFAKYQRLLLSGVGLTNSKPIFSSLELYRSGVYYFINKVQNATIFEMGFIDECNRSSDEASQMGKFSRRYSSKKRQLLVYNINDLGFPRPWSPKDTTDSPRSFAKDSWVCAGHQRDILWVRQNHSCGRCI